MTPKTKLPKSAPYKNTESMTFNFVLLWRFAFVVDDISNGECYFLVAKALLHILQILFVCSIFFAISKNSRLDDGSSAVSFSNQFVHLHLLLPSLNSARINLYLVFHFIRSLQGVFVLSRYKDRHAFFFLFSKCRKNIFNFAYIFLTPLLITH